MTVSTIQYMKDLRGNRMENKMDIKTGDMVRVSDSPDGYYWYNVKELLGRTPEGDYIVMSDEGNVTLSYKYAELDT